MLRYQLSQTIVIQYRALSARVCPVPRAAQTGAERGWACQCLPDGAGTSHAGYCGEL